MRKRNIVNLILLTRVLSAVYILFDPVWGFISSTFFDWFDWYILENKTKVLTVPQYQRWDKNVDWFMYSAMLVSGIWYGSSGLLLVLFIFKLIGHLVYLKTEDRKIFILFPNFLEGAFIWTVFLKTSGTPGLLILILLEFVKEIWMHFVKPWYIKSFGYPRFLGYKHAGTS